MDTLVTYLMQCDLTQNDAIVYLWLLKHGLSNPSDIAEGTGIKRPRVYDSLKRLIDRGFVAQELEQKRPQYIVTNARLLLKDLETQIGSKKTALDKIQECIIDQPPSPVTKGIFLLNSDEAIRLEIQKALQASQKKITIMAVLPTPLTEEPLIPLDLLGKKSLEGQDISLILNVSAKNWEDCVDCATKKVKVYHYPTLKQIPTLIHLIDNNLLCISSSKLQKDTIYLDFCLFFSGDRDFITAFEFLLQGFIQQSTSLKDRFTELKKSIIYPMDKLKTLFGMEE